MEATQEIEQIQLHKSEPIQVQDASLQIQKVIQPKIIKLDKAFPAKRKKVVLNFVQKFEILDKLKAGMKVSDIAQEYNIGVTTVCDIRKNGDEKLLKYRKENMLNLSRKSMKTSEFPLLDKALKLWVYQERTKQYTLTDNIFQTKAVEFFRILYPNSKRVFKASHGYVAKFCNRFEISLKNEPSKMYADLSKLDAFIIDFHELHYTPEQIYNADECGLNYVELPIISESKKKISLMLCCNASGKHRLPLVMVNQTPIGQNKLPVYFQTSSRAWMTQEIFETWFHKEFVPKVRAYLSSIHQEEKAILLLDNCPSHPMKLESNDGRIKCIFLPSETSSVLMPMNQGPIAYLKRKYRTNFLRLTCADENFLKYHSIRNTIYSLANLWEEMPENLLRVCWQKMKINLNFSCSLEPIDMVELRNNFASLGLSLTDMEINSWLDVDFDDPGYGLLTDSEIIDLVRSEADLTKTELDSGLNQSNSEVLSNKKAIIDSSTAFTYCTELMQWLEAQDTSRSEDLIFIQRVKELASGSQQTMKKLENESNTNSNVNSFNEVQINHLPVTNSHISTVQTQNLSNEVTSNVSNNPVNNFISDAETLTLCFLSENGAISDSNGKIIIQGNNQLTSL